MACPHYKVGDNTCTLCLQEKIRQLQEDLKRVQRENRALMQRLGEEPKDL